MSEVHDYGDTPSEVISNLQSEIKVLKDLLDFERTQSKSWKDEYLKVISEGGSTLVSVLRSQIIELQKSLIEQGQKFNDQSQLIKDLEYKLNSPNLVAQNIRDYINQLQGALSSNQSNMCLDDVRTMRKLISNLKECLGGADQ
jgi:hypothetical protein